MVYSSNILRDSDNLFHLQIYLSLFLSHWEYNNRQNDVYRQSLPHRDVMNNDGSPTIVDTVLTLILKTGQEAFHFHFCLYREPIISWWQCATCRPTDYPWYLTNNCWHSFSWWGREHIALCFAYRGGQKFLYDWLQPMGGVISQDALPKIVDCPLTLIFTMGQGVCCNLLGI